MSGGFDVCGGVGCDRRLLDNCGKDAPPKPWLSMEPQDLTSLIGTVPVRVAVSSPGSYALSERPVLDAIAGSLRLVELPTGAAVTFSTEIQEALAIADGGAGYQQTYTDYVDVNPLTPLAPENWYELQLSLVPTEVKPNTPHLRNLPGGGESARFTTGHHPTLQSLYGCLRSDGTFDVHLTFSETVDLTADIGTQLTFEPEQPSDVCTLELPSLPASTLQEFRFGCQLGTGTKRQFRLSVSHSITAPTGAPFEASLGVQGDYSISIEESMWQEYDSACSSVALQ